MSLKISSTSAVKQINIPSVSGTSSNANKLSVFSGFKNSEAVWTPMLNISVDSITFPNGNIILNGGDTPIGPTGTGFYASPIASNTGPNFLYYNNTTKEITYNPVGLSTTITIVGGDSTTHEMTFENGLLISYVTY